MAQTFPATAGCFDSVSLSGVREVNCNVENLDHEPQTVDCIRPTSPEAEAQSSSFRGSLSPTFNL